MKAGDRRCRMIRPCVDFHGTFANLPKLPDLHFSELLVPGRQRYSSSEQIEKASSLRFCAVGML